MNVRSVFIAFLMLFAYAASGQQMDLLMGRWHSSRLEKEVLQTQKLVHLSSKPVIIRNNRDSLSFDFLKDSAKYYSKLMSGIMRDHLFLIKGRDYLISGDVLLDYGVGREYRPDSSEYLYNGHRGFVVQAVIGKRFRFNSGFYEVQNTVPEYLNLFVEQNGVFPGWGRVKDYKGGDFDFSKSFGRASFEISSCFEAHFGYGNHFIGNGYRSLLVTDGLMNSPYIELNWKSQNDFFQYRTWYSNLQTLERLPLGDTPESLFERKSGLFHYLSFKPFSWIELGVFEGVVSKRVTDTSIVKLSLMNVQPLLGLNALVDGWDGESNVYGGVNLVLSARESMFYGQLMLDDPGTQRYGFQVGLKTFGLGLNGLSTQFELNQTSRYSYSGRVDHMSFSQFNQPLGHPLGGGVTEYLGILEYRHKRYFGRLKYNSIRFDKGPGGDWRSENMSDSMSDQDQVNQLDAQMGMQLNLHTNAELYINYVYRDGTYNSNFFMLGIRTNLHNNYFDF